MKLLIIPFHSMPIQHAHRTLCRPASARCSWVAELVDDRLDEVRLSLEVDQATLSTEVAREVRDWRTRELVAVSVDLQRVMGERFCRGRLVVKIRVQLNAVDDEVEPGSSIWTEYSVVGGNEASS